MGRRSRHHRGASFAPMPIYVQGRRPPTSPSAVRPKLGSRYSASSPNVCSSVPFLRIPFPERQSMPGNRKLWRGTDLLQEGSWGLRPYTLFGRLTFLPHGVWIMRQPSCREGDTLRHADSTSDRSPTRGRTRNPAPTIAQESCAVCDFAMDASVSEALWPRSDGYARVSR